MKKVNYHISINAPKETVWEIIWGNESYKKWTSVFSEGSDAITDWQEGSKAHFTNGQGEGMVARIAKRIEHEFLSIEHLGMLSGGKEILEGPEIDKWKGSLENYTLKEEGGVTRLDIDMDVSEEWADHLNEKWPKALEKLKAMAEL
ncbi:MAG: SRPBCC domain-containing protein [Sphingobacteriales bacterium]|nr:MAG: SRPBCC domain-containing protein [Sphingobacteriales bacterium]